MPARERHPGRLGAGQCQANPVTHVSFRINCTITTRNGTFNHVFREGVADILTIKKQHKPSDFISVAKARQKILLQTGRTVSYSTAVKWVAQNNLGHKLPGERGQWIVDGVLFQDFLQEVKGCDVQSK